MKKLNFRQLKYSIWMYLILYAAMIIAVLWILQIVFLDSFYQRVRYNSLIEYGNELTSQMKEDEVDSEMVENWIKTCIEANEFGIYSYFLYFDKNDEMVVESPYSNLLPGDNKPQTNGPDGVENSAIFDQVVELINALDESGRSYICDYFTGNDNSTQFCVYASPVKNTLGEFTVVMVASNQQLSEILTVIQYQLTVVTLIVVIISFAISWIIANKLSEPIQRLSATAKMVAEGDYTVDFRGNSYDELNELAQSLNFAKEQLAKTGSLQRDLLANVSHDLKTPLTMIKAYAEMIRDISGDNKIKREQHTNVIIEEADRLALLVNDILNLSKLQNNSETLEFSQVNLSELIERVIYRFENALTEKGYHIIKDIDDDLFVYCDEQKIEQVVYNLIGNSLNYTGVDKTVKVYLRKKEVDKILLEIIDSGKGISPDKIGGIWEKYYRISDTHHRPVKGTGLGLSIVKTILESHKLKFGVISKEGVGSNFFVEFKEMSDEK